MYYGVTIGPIIETLNKAQKTLEIWAASYMFSRLAKNIAENLNDKVEFIIPYVIKDNKKDNGIGMYHDRLVFKSDLSLDEIEKVIYDVKFNLAKDIAKVLKEDENRVNNYIQKYIKTYIVAKNDSQNLIEEIYDILNHLEFNDEVYQFENYIDRFLIRENILKSNLLKSSGKKGFDSIPEIASKASGIEIGYKEDDSDYYLELKNKLKDDFKQVYKYIAIVHADGDNLGKVVKGINDNSISKILFDFGSEAKEILKKYSCNTIFIGGDDLLFFAPVIMKVKNENDEYENKTIFDLLDEIRTAYNDKFNNSQTSLSFGVSITYYKYPLSEALKLSRDALFNKAKTEKNSVAVSVRKHSGQMNELILRFDDKRYEYFKEFLNKSLNDEIDLPFSVHYKLKNLESILKLLNDFDGFFENYFNEDIHKQKFKEGLEYIKILIEKSPADNRLKVVFAIVNIIKLLKGKK